VCERNRKFYQTPLGRSKVPLEFLSHLPLKVLGDSHVWVQLLKAKELFLIR